MKTVHFQIYSTGEMQPVTIKKQLVCMKSQYQLIEVIDSLEYGRCLVIDGIMQATESDHSLYDVAITANISPGNNRILIFGGADGFVAAHVLKHGLGGHITVVDIDPMVSSVCRDAFSTTVFDDPRVDVIHSDAIRWLSTVNNACAPRYDAILCDLTDNPQDSTDTRHEYATFYSSLLTGCRALISEGGTLCAQGGASSVIPPHLDTARLMIASMRSAGYKSVSRADIVIPSYGEALAFISGENI